jgi:NAD(P)-dependent dehydrogenase (short-subunit alcohol dehydrogenase family)
LLGGVAVHGIHILLWALDLLAAEHEVRGFSRLRVQFESGVVVGDAVDCVWQRDAHRFLAKIAGPSGTSARIALTPAEIDAAEWTVSPSVENLECEEHELSDLLGKTGDLSLGLLPEWKDSFPHLAAAFPPSTIAALLATTRLVGMVVPGRHSIYSGLELICQAASPTSALLHYEVSRIDPRVSLVEIAVRANGLSGKVTAFVRPKPRIQPRLEELIGAVQTGEFAGQEAIVVGGSRGLGELAAKLLSVGGANVTITWKLGEPEAQAIAAEAAALGRHIQTLSFDVISPPLDEPLPQRPYTHLYYLATPRIPTGVPGKFNPSAFKMLLDTYLGGLTRTADWAVPRSIPDACIWFPSTVFIDRPDPHFAEYTAAKACGEVLCRQLSIHMAPLRFLAERLPRLPTDQTQGLTSTEAADGVATILASLRRCRIGGRDGSFFSKDDRRS